MKKVLSIVAALLLCVGTQAQIVSSRSAIVKTQKQASNTQWFLRAGLNIMNLNGDGVEADSNIGYNATFGYQKPMGGAGAYWGMEFCCIELCRNRNPTFRSDRLPSHGRIWNEHRRNRWTELKRIQTLATMLHSAIKSLWAVPEHIGEWNSASVPVGLKPMK